MRSRPTLWLVSLLAFVLAGAECPPDDRYVATIERTTYGIPHITAEDWGGLGYGYGYAFAQDNACVLAREIVDATAQASRFFGPEGGRLEDDLFYAFWARDEVVQRFFDAIEPELQELARGYAAGYNRYLRETGRAGLPEECRDAEWVQTIDELDLFKVYAKLVDRAGASNLIDQIVAAVPPDVASEATPERREADRKQLAAVTPEAFRAAVPPMEMPPVDHMGSNMVAVGKDVTTTGAGMLLVNPHFPWRGPLRFYQVHVTIPGVIDSMGASLFGSPLPNIAFNRNVAWSHTVSTARRFVLRQLELAPGDPFTYLVDGVPHPIEPVEVSVEVLQPDGTLATESHTFWTTEFGPIMAFPPLITWNTFAAIAVEDPAQDNTRIFDQFLRMNTASSLDEFIAAVEEEAALPWVNTAATDRSGDVWYGDVGMIPNVTPTQFNDCTVGATPLLLGFGALLLDGATGACASGTDADSAQPRTLGASNMPSLRRTDWVQNSNDSYWLTNPAAPLEGFSPLIGQERNSQGFRTRLGIRQIEERLAGTDGLSGNQFDLAAVQNLITANRNYSAEVFLDDVLTLCDEESNEVSLGSETVDVGPACAVLAAWSRSNDIEAVGALVWRAAWPRIRGVDDLFAVPFDANDAVNTPSGIDLSNATVRGQVMSELAEAVQFLADSGLAVDAAWGDAHFDPRNGTDIPIPGGPGSHGVYNAIGSGFSSGAGYTPITSGSSIVMAIEFLTGGGVDVRGLLTYSQSTDPANPFFADQTQLFSMEGWNDLPFERSEIEAARISEMRIVEPRDRPQPPLD